jgi:hypothetical protein
MRSLRAVALLGTVLAIALIGAPVATAATEAGDECVGNLAGGPFTLVPEAHASGGALPLSAPTAGVVTAWKVNSGLTATVPEFMAAFRPTGKSGTFEVIGESNQEDVKQGLNVFSTRIPVHAGDRFGPVPVGEESPVYCSTGNSGDEAWSFPGSVGVGSIHTYAAGIKTRVPLVAVIEPDRDGDGYGDETQDGCPQSAAYQGPCPTISLDTFPIVLKRSILVLVGASESSWVQVFGQVGWKPRHKGGALASKTPGKPGDHMSIGVIIGLSGGTTLVKPGEVTPYNVKLPKSVIRHLSDISPKQVVKGTITAQTTDLAGRVTEHTITIRLHGRGPVHSAGTS